MADNVLLKVTQELQASLSYNEMLSNMTEALIDLDKIYSYIVYGNYEDTKLTKYIIVYTISQTEKYNTLFVDNIISEIMEIIVLPKEQKRVLGYNQPDIEVMIEAYDPLVNKLAKQQAEHWKCFEHEDLCQMCRLTMLKLYRKGYYIHKRLLYKSFNNDILMSLRHERNRPTIVSFEDTFYRAVSADSEKLLVADIVPDTEIQEEEERKLQEENTLLIFNEVKDIIVELIGVRQFDELMRDYGNKHTTSWSRKCMQKIKNHFTKLGLSRKDFDNKYYD